MTDHYKDIINMQSADNFADRTRNLAQHIQQALIALHENITEAYKRGQWK